METIDVSNIQLFKDYLKKKEELFSSEIHLPYLIGSPTELFKDNTLSKKNNALVPVVILIKKRDGSIEFEEAVFNWSSIDLLRTYSTITETGQLAYLENNENFKNMFSDEVINVDVSEVEELSLTEVITRYPFYRKLSLPLQEKYKDEKFLSIKSQDMTYVIPSIEVVRYFYCYSARDSLKHAIFHPSGIKLLAGKLDKDLLEKRYDLYLETIAKTEDNKKIFYFLRDSAYTLMFNQVYYEYKTNRIIRAPFPFEKEFSMYCRVLKFPSQSNVALVVQVLDSTMLSNLFTSLDIELHVHHPLSKRKENKTGKRDASKDRKKNVPTQQSEEVDDQLSSQTSIPEQLITNQIHTAFFLEEEKNSIIEKNGQREEQGGKTIIIPKDTNGLTTQGSFETSSEKAQKAVTSSQKDKIVDYPPEIPFSGDEDINESENLISDLLNAGYTVHGTLLFAFPDKNSTKKMAISYLDKAKTIKRKYLFLYFSTSSKDFIYIDVEKKDNIKKEVLVLVNQTDEIAHKCIYQQVYYGNHKWLSKESLGLVDGTDFFRIRHGKTASMLKDIENNITSL